MRSIRFLVRRKKRIIKVKCLFIIKFFLIGFKEVLWGVFEFLEEGGGYGRVGDFG